MSDLPASPGARDRAIERGFKIAESDLRASERVDFDAPGLDEVCAVLPTTNPAAVLNFLIHPDVRLGNRTPLSALHQGDLDAVLDAARSCGTDGG